MNFKGILFSLFSLTFVFSVSANELKYRWLEQFFLPYNGGSYEERSEQTEWFDEQEKKLLEFHSQLFMLIANFSVLTFKLIPQINFLVKTDNNESKDM